MSDDQALKMYETRAELDDIREEMIQIRNQNNEMRNRLVADDLVQTVNDFRINISTRVQTIQESFNDLSENVASLSTRVLNHDQILSDMNDNLRKINEILNKQSETLNRQNDTIQILKTNVEPETILLLGGYDGENRLDSLLILENNKESWKQLNIKLPYPVWDHGAQLLNNNLYIFGGEIEKNSSNWTYKLSKSLQWEKMADMNQKRDRILNNSVILDNQIWVCGGWDGEEVLKSVEMYDPEINEWKYMKEMNEGRDYAAAAVVNGKIFCSGGVWINSVEYYDPSSDVWTIICNMPQYIWGHGGVEIDGNLIFVGGYDNEYLKNVREFNTTDKNAKLIEKPPMSIPREHFGIAKIDGKVFVCGGETREDSKCKYLDSVEIFDGEVWRNGPKIPTPRRSAPAVIIPMEFKMYLK